MLEVVNIDIDAGKLDLRDNQNWLGELMAYLGEGACERIIFMPPLLANTVCLSPRFSRLGLGGGTLLSMLTRPIRFASVFFAYPGIGRKRLPWAVMHDKMEAFLRDGLGQLAKETNSTVITTVLADHPRTHWEAWPERGDLYHSVQTITSDGDPVAALRQRRPETSFGHSIDIDPEDGKTGWKVMAGERHVGVVWDGDPRSSPQFDGTPGVVWCPQIRPDAPAVEPAQLLRGCDSIHAVVTTGACQQTQATSTIYTRRANGGLEAHAPDHQLCGGLTVTRTKLPI